MAKIKQIRFHSDEMIRALLDGRKTVTRLPMKPQPGHPVPGRYNCYIYCGIPWELDDLMSFAPYCLGDILYVREAWGDYSECQTGGAGYYLYRADYPDGTKTCDFDGNICDLPRWRPSIHMPREAARIFLRVAGVGMEYLQDISDGDVLAEGTPDSGSAGANLGYFADNLWDSAIKSADRSLYGWVANPWVWVVRFERISKELAI